MERRALGASGAMVGSVGLGTSTWGRGTDRLEAREQVAMLVASGGNLIDVDPVATDPGFVAEAVVAAGLRAEVFVAVRSPARSSRRDLLASLDASLRATGIGHADLWVLEGWDDCTQDGFWEELVSALSVAQVTGRAHYAGVAPARPWQGALVGAGLATHPDRSRLTAIETPVSLLDAPAAAEMTRVAEAFGSSVIAAWPLAGGVLTGKYRHSTPPDSRGAGERFAARLHHYRAHWTRPVVEALCAAAEGLAVAPASLALSWARDSPRVTSVVVGARTIHQWRAALESSSVVLPAEIRYVLDEVAAHARDIGQDEGDV